MKKDAKLFFLLVGVLSGMALFAQVALADIAPLPVIPKPPVSNQNGNINPPVEPVNLNAPVEPVNVNAPVAPAGAKTMDNVYAAVGAVVIGGSAVAGIALWLIKAKNVG